MTLKALFEPKSIAVIGASQTQGELGYVILENIKKSFKGEIFPINPEITEILDLKCYLSIEQIENPIDLAIIAIPADMVKSEVDKCIKKGIKAVIIITGGFSEIGKKELRIELKNAIKGKKIRILGPNCLGVLMPKGLNTLFLTEKRFKMPNEGLISVITQSGSIGVDIIDLFALNGIGLAKFVSYGNAIDIDEAELIEYLSKDLATRCIAVCLESIENGTEFIEKVKKISKNKPIVILKAGKTQKGIKTILSHVGNEPGPEQIYSAAFKQTDIVEVQTLDELIDCSKALANQPAPKTNKILVVTDSGGFGVLAADACAGNNFELTELSKETAAALKGILPEYSIIGNPLDLGNDIDSERFQQVLELVFKEKVDSVLCILSFKNPKMEDMMLSALQNCKVYGKTILVCSSGSEYTLERTRKLEGSGIPVYPTPERAVRSLKVLLDYGKMVGKK